MRKRGERVGMKASVFAIPLKLQKKKDTQLHDFPLCDCFTLICLFQGCSYCGICDGEDPLLEMYFKKLEGSPETGVNTSHFCL